jgi:hypothetical protein
MNSEAVAAILSALNDECGRLNDGADYEAQRVVLRAYAAIGKIRAEDVDLVRLDHFNGSGGALSWNHRSFAIHPDRCKCQGNDPIPHRHYDYAPYDCARCLRCRGYSPKERI